MRSADEGQTAFYRRIRELSLSYSLYSFLAMQTSMYLKNIVVRRVLVSFEIESVGQKVAKPFFWTLSMSVIKFVDNYFVMLDMFWFSGEIFLSFSPLKRKKNYEPQKFILFRGSKGKYSNHTHSHEVPQIMNPKFILTG